MLITFLKFSFLWPLGYVRGRYSIFWKYFTDINVQALFCYNVTVYIKVTVDYACLEGYAMYVTFYLNVTVYIHIYVIVGYVVLTVMSLRDNSSTLCMTSKLHIWGPYCLYL